MLPLRGETSVAAAANHCVGHHPADILQHPWFLFNLPPGTEALNQALLQNPIAPEFQTVEELERIVSEAKEVSAGIGVCS